MRSHISAIQIYIHRLLLSLALQMYIMPLQCGARRSLESSHGDKDCIHHIGVGQLLLKVCAATCLLKSEGAGMSFVANPYVVSLTPQTAIRQPGVLGIEVWPVVVQPFALVRQCWSNSARPKRRHLPMRPLARSGCLLKHCNLNAVRSRLRPDSVQNSQTNHQAVLMLGVSYTNGFIMTKRWINSKSGWLMDCLLVEMLQHAFQGPKTEISTQHGSSSVSAAKVDHVV